MALQDRLRSLGLTLPPAPAPVASYVPAVRTGNLVYTSGQIPTVSGELRYRGLLGLDLSEDEGREAARIAALNALAAIGTAADLDSIRQIVRLTGYVASEDGFTGQPEVINGASDLLIELFGENGRHSRAAVGVAALPLGAAVEIDLIVEVEA